MQKKQKYTAEEIFKESMWVTIGWEWFQTLLGRAVDTVLWITMIFACYQLIPGAAQPPKAVSVFMFVAQFVALDIGGLSLNQMARGRGLPKYAYARIVAYILIGITLLTLTFAGLERAVPNLSKDFMTWVEVVLVVARSVMTVLYGQAIHSFKAEEHAEQNRIAELEQALSVKSTELDTLTAQLNTKQEELNTRTAQFNTQLNTLQQQLNTLRVKVNTKEEEISVLSVKLESKEAQLANVKGAHEGSLEAIQEATLSVKAQLTNARHEVESLQSQLLSTQGSLQAEKQLNTQLNTQLDTLTAQLNTRTAQFNTQLNTLQQQLNTKVNEVNTLRVKVNTKEEEVHTETDDPDTHKIVQLDPQTREGKNYELRIRNLLANEPGLPGREISRRIGCSVPTACRWKEVIEKEDRAV